MRRLSRSRRGLSEIVGTLMLVLIVVAAAVAFSFFVASYEKQLTTEESFSQQRGLEELRILSLTPQMNRSGAADTWSFLNFTLASEYVNPSVITSIALNGFGLASYSETPLAQLGVPNATKIVTYNTTFSVASRSQYLISIDVNDSTAYPLFSLFDHNESILTSSYIKIDVYTALLNDFSQTFVPPTAIAIISGVVTLNATGFPETIPILDGSNSFQPVNGTIVEWLWSVDESSPHVLNATTIGEKAAFPGAVGSPPPTGSYFNITLQVINGWGLTASTTIPYHYLSG